MMNTLLNYPEIHKDSIIEDFHGIKVPDPYRWLENPESEMTKKWIEKEDDVTRTFLNSIESYEETKKRVTELWNYPKYSVPSKEGNRYFFFKNDGLQNQAVLYMQETLESPLKVIIDPNKLSTDGTVALSGVHFSKDGNLLAYGISSSGSDRQEIKIKNINTEDDYDEVIKWCKFTSIAWKKDNSGFFYNRYPEPGTVSSQDENNFSTVYWHKLGTHQSEDKLVYEEPSRKELGFSPFITDDGKYLFLYVFNGTANENMLYYRKVEDNDASFVKLIDTEEANYNPIDTEGDILFLNTNLNAPHYKVIAIDLTQPEKENWKEIIPEQKDVMSMVNIINDKFVVLYLKDAHHRLKIFDLAGKFIKEIRLPGIGSIEGFSGNRKDDEMFYKFTSFTYPPGVFHYDFKINKSFQIHDSELDFNSNDYETHHEFFKSKDGTKIPMFITHRKDMKMDGNNPVILYGYGGFNVSLTPGFMRPVWLENGGILVIVNLRGGGEYGQKWHRAGMLENKQNVFDDFISAAECLIKNKYTNPKKIAIMGGSNGGLLVAACMLQRPELFGAVVCSVPVIDMLRYHKFTVGRYWVPEYGNAEENPEHFKFMYAYSPLHNVREDVSYPPVLITTGDTDDRVVPAHALKFAATLQNAGKGKNTILLRFDKKAGHGAGKPTHKMLEEQTDIYSFLFKIFEMK